MTDKIIENMTDEQIKAAKREYQRRYLETHPEQRKKRNELSAAWKKAHPDRQREYVRNFYARKAKEYAAEKSNSTEGDVYV